jgi:hypothetical protein
LQDGVHLLLHLLLLPHLLRHLYFRLLPQTSLL